MCFQKGCILPFYIYLPAEKSLLTYYSYEINNNYHNNIKEKTLSLDQYRYRHISKFRYYDLIVSETMWIDASLQHPL